MDKAVLVRGKGAPRVGTTHGIKISNIIEINDVEMLFHAVAHGARVMGEDVQGKKTTWNRCRMMLTVPTTKKPALRSEGGPMMAVKP